MSDRSGTSVPARIIIRFALNTGLVWLLQAKMSAAFAVTGGLHAWVVIGALLTLMNILIRPLLHLITLPLKLFATILAVIIVNAVFVQLTASIVAKMDPAVVTLAIGGGWMGWFLVAVILGTGNWLMKVIVK